jgi:hypothetical protein
MTPSESTDLESHAFLRGALKFVVVLQSASRSFTQAIIADLFKPSQFENGVFK